MQYSDPYSGQVIADFEGAENFTTITCNIVTASGDRAITRWGIENFRGVSTLQNILASFEPTLVLISEDNFIGLNIADRLTILRLAPELANFPIRIYRKFIVYTVHI